MALSHPCVCPQQEEEEEEGWVQAATGQTVQSVADESELCVKKLISLNKNYSGLKPNARLKAGTWLQLAEMDDGEEEEEDAEATPLVPPPSHCRPCSRMTT